MENARLLSRAGRKKKTTAGALLAIGLLGGQLTAAGQVPAERFSLKVFAGYGSAGFGDLDKAGEGHNARFGDLASLWGFEKTGEIALPHGGPDLGAEILVRVAPRLDIGLGGGLLARPSRESEVSVRQAPAGASSLHRWTVSASAVPLTLNAYYRVSLAPRISGLIQAGLGCYFANFKLTSFRQSALLGVQTWSQTVSRGRDYALGFQAGLALEYEINTILVCFVEGNRRFANFKNWAIKYTYSSPSATYDPQTSSAWFAEELNGDTGKVYSVFFYSDTKSTSAYLQGVREAQIDFSGWSIRAGLRLRFGTS